jgi:predicted glycoside hydrolase/deacetylase ChbG (UPF0249 family)
MARATENGTPIALCADDYAFAPGIDEGLLALAVRGRITALSCMTASPHWPQAGPRLAPLYDKLDIGLHFTLTQLAPLGAMPALAPGGKLPGMGALYLRALAGRIDAKEIEQELTRQLDAFAKVTGRAPDFLDSHHHVHQLPGVRDAVARIWQARGERGWVRNTASGRKAASAPIRSAALAWFGRAAKQAWDAAGIATNSDFAGVRSFRERQSFGALMRGWLTGAQPGLLVMCHPGYPDEELARIDHVTTTRADELAYLSSEEFSGDLAAAGCRLARLSSLAAPRSRAAAG